ncbi:3'-5' exonuclease [Odoribacter lunatus]|uniref:3'-5' exonuclease n=1 Tax=Odoribacter lunatus TaxID=2941335 RepID=UPI00203B7189|nr:3'-5' exonuclease [Odoribacter lunatus]
MNSDYKQTISSEEIINFPVFVYKEEVVLIEDASKVDEAVNFLTSYSCIGFDTETRPAFRKGEHHKVCLLQLAVQERVYLFRLNKCGFSHSLRNLLANEKIKKIGVGIRDDVKALQQLGPFIPQAFIDLQIFAEQFGIKEKSFSKLMAIIFQVKISKRQRTSNWEALQLTESQIRYAATDAWGALKMYMQLKKDN